MTLREKLKCTVGFLVSKKVKGRSITDLVLDVLQFPERTKKSWKFVLLFFKAERSVEVIAELSGRICSRQETSFSSMAMHLLTQRYMLASYLIKTAFSFAHSPYSPYSPYSPDLGPSDIFFVSTNEVKHLFNDKR